MATISQTSPDNFSIQDYTFEDYDIVPNFEVTSLFQPEEDLVEYFIYDANSNLIHSEYKSTSYSFTQDPSIVNLGGYSTINIDPEKDLSNLGFDVGQYNIVYNFFEPQLNSNFDLKFYLKEISSDRTELRLASNNLKVTPEIFAQFSQKLQGENYFNEFYLNFGDNQVVIAVNALQEGEDILIKLYEPLPQLFTTKFTCWITLKIADPVAYNVSFIQENDVTPSVPYLKGPNTNIQIKNEINNSTDLKSYEELISSNLTSSYQQVNNLLNQKDISINIDYTNYSNFIYFSSAEQRLLNFYEKVSLIESSSNQLNSIDNQITGSTSSSYYVSGSKSYHQNIIDNTIKNFDGYEYFLYFNSGSKSWPKSNSTYPYNLYPTGSSQVLNWLGSSNESSVYYGGEALSSSRFDNDNLNSLTNLVPEYITDDSQNSGYQLFIEMIGQHFDSIWVYIKDVTNKFDADNRLNYGISKDLVAQAVRDLGLKIYQNQFSQDDLFSAFLGITPSGSLLPSTGSELIETYVTASSDVTPLDDVNKAIYKRLYHNLPYLLNKKGTIQGIKALIASYGIPNTILRVSEFGGKDRDNSNDWDYWYNKFGYSFYTSGSTFLSSSFSLNSDWGAVSDVPGAVEFRFKSDGIPTEQFSQSLWSTDGGVELQLLYEGSGSASGSYSGSVVDSYNTYGYLNFYPDYSTPANSASVYLPFFDRGWWSVLINSSSDGYELFSKNKLYIGEDASLIGFQSSASTNPTEPNWGTSTLSYFASGSQTIFSGSLQEIRYYKTELSESVFDDYVMNQLSAEGNSRNTSPLELAFRAPLGSELDTGSRESVHPKITGSWTVTQSFASDSDFTFSADPIFVPGTEYIFLDQPAIGIRNRITDKVKIGDQILPSGSNQVLSQYQSVEQQLAVSQSFTDNVNLLEVAFSPQNEINDDIIEQIGYFNIGDYIGDRRYATSDNDRYEDLYKLASEYFEKYTHNYDVFDYIRLIKYFDNSLFKMIKDFVPAKTSLQSGVVVKQHLLERNRIPGFQLSYEQNDYSGSISIGSIEGGAAGSVNKYNTPVARLRLQDNNVASELILGSTPLTAFTSSTYAFIDTGSFESTGDLGTFVETSNDDVETGKAFPDTTGIFTNITDFDYTGDVEFSIRNTIATATDITVDIVEVGVGPVATITADFPGQTTTFLRGGDFNNFTFKAGTSYFVQLSSTGTPTTRRFVLRFLQEGSPNNVAGQYYGYNLDTIEGPHLDADFTEKQFYNGEYSGSEFIVTTQDLAPGCRVYLDAIPESFNYSASIFDSSAGNYNSTLSTFINTDTTIMPSGSGRIYFFLDSNRKVSKIRISKTDANGINQTDLLQQLSSLSTISELGSFTYTVDGSPQDIGNEYLLSLANSNPTPTSTKNNILDIEFAVSTSIQGDPTLYNMVEVLAENGLSPSSSLGGDGFFTDHFISASARFSINRLSGPAFPLVQLDRTYRGSQQDNGLQLDVPSYNTDNYPTAPWFVGNTINDGGNIAFPSLNDTIFPIGASDEFLYGNVTGTVTAVNSDVKIPFYFVIYEPDFNGDGSTILARTEFLDTNNSNIDTTFASFSEDTAPSPTNYLNFTSGSGGKVYALGLVTESYTQGQTNSALTTFLGFQDLKITLGQMSPNNSNRGTIETLLETSSPSGFINSDCDVLQGNADDDRTSGLYMDVDYSTNATVAVNQDAILADNAPKADVQDSNYTLARHKNPRYDGSRSTSQQVNEWSEGDTNTYGKSATVDSEKTFYAYFDFINGLSPELKGKSIAHIQFLVDESGANIPPDSSSLALTQGTFKTDEYVFVNLNDPTRFETPMNQLNGKKQIIRGGYRVDALLYTDSGSSYIEDINFDTGSFSVTNYEFAASRTGNLTIGAGTNVVYNWNVTTKSNPQWDVSTDKFTFSTDSDNQVNFQSRVYLSGTTGGTFEILLKKNYVSGDPASSGDTLDTTGVLGRGTFSENFTLNSGFQNFESGDEITVVIKNISYNSLSFNVGSIDYFQSTNKVNPTGTVSSAFWRGTGSVDIWVTASADLSSLYGSKQLDVIPYDGTTSIPEFDPIIQNFTVNVGDEIRFKGAETYTRMISDVIEPNVDSEGLLRIKLNEVLPSSGSVSSGDGYQTLLDHFLLRRYINDASYVILDADKPLGSTSPGIMRPEYVTDQLDRTLPDSSQDIIKNIT
ncbi:MAG: hypothetical protein HKN40_05895 [Winogradskyella sp.]|uniref:hypothetical protein n=1 Tax=Winogradskyella sp. TaxID=1883156 RepID=UPI001809CFC5|nr:hypothetical protein [Winogradskyella sp.]